MVDDGLNTLVKALIDVIRDPDFLSWKNEGNGVKGTVSNGIQQLRARKMWGTVSYMPRLPSNVSPLRDFRVSLALSQEEFAQKLGCSASYVKAVELGRRTLNDPTLHVLLLFMDAVRKSVDDEWPAWHSLRRDIEHVRPKSQLQLFIAHSGGLHEGRIDFAEEQALAHFRSHEKPRLEALLRRAEAEGCAGAVLLRLNEWIEATIEKFSLDERKCPTCQSAAMPSGPQGLTRQSDKTVAPDQTECGPKTSVRRTR